MLGTRGPLTLGGPLDFAYPAYPIVTPLRAGLQFMLPATIGPTTIPTRLSCLSWAGLGGYFSAVFSAVSAPCNVPLVK